MSERSISSLEFVCDASKYALSMVIGQGHDESVTVSLARYKDSGHFFALKKISLDSEDICFNLIQNEAVLTRQLRHKNLLPSFCTFVNHHELWIISPLMEYGSCQDLIGAHFTEGLAESAISYILRDVLLALRYLHTSFIIHRGVQASHILISVGGNVRLSGLRDAFDMTRHGALRSRVCDFPINDPRKLPWLSPEILEQNLLGYGTKSDIYSIGITACQLANSYAPFSEVAPTLMLLEKVKGLKPMLFDLTTVPDLEISAHTGNQTDSGLGGSVTNNQASIIRQRLFSKHFHAVVFRSLEKEPTHRPSAAELLSHSFLKNLRKDTTSILPALLHPVTPLKVADIDHSYIDMSQLTNELEGMRPGDMWDFS